MTIDEIKSKLETRIAELDRAMGYEADTAALVLRDMEREKMKSADLQGKFDILRENKKYIDGCVSAIRMLMRNRMAAADTLKMLEGKEKDNG